MMNSEFIFSVSRSKTLIFSLNRFGLAISYDELMSYHSNIASCITEVSNNHVPFPGHFSPCRFTIGTPDNFDHEEATLSGTLGSHDSVLILMQDKLLGRLNQRKPNISETSFIHRKRQFNQKLACQELWAYNRSTKKPRLSEQYEVPSGLHNMHAPIIRKSGTGRIHGLKVIRSVRYQWEHSRMLQRPPGILLIHL